MQDGSNPPLPSPVTPPAPLAKVNNYSAENMLLQHGSEKISGLREAFNFADLLERQPFGELLEEEIFVRIDCCRAHSRAAAPAPRHPLNPG